MDRAGAGIRRDNGAGAASALTSGENRRFTDSATAKPEPLRLVLIVLFAADIGFVDLDNAAQLRRIVVARVAEALEHEPCALLSDPVLIGELQARDALPRRDEQIHGVEPLMERNFGPLEDGAGADGEVREGSDCSGRSRPCGCRSAPPRYRSGRRPRKASASPRNWRERCSHRGTSENGSKVLMVDLLTAKLPGSGVSIQACHAHIAGRSRRRGSPRRSGSPLSSAVPSNTLPKRSLGPSQLSLSAMNRAARSRCR